MFKNNKLNDKKGVVLLLVLGTTLIVVILANVLLNIMLNQSRITEHEIRRIQAYYATLAGMNYALEQCRTGNWGPSPGANSRGCINCSGSGVPAGNRIPDLQIPYVVWIDMGPLLGDSTFEILAYVDFVNPNI